MRWWSCDGCDRLVSLEDIKLCKDTRLAGQMPDCRLDRVLQREQRTGPARAEGPEPVMLDLAGLTGKIEEADRTLQQEAVEATRAVHEREKDVLAFCRRLIAIVRVVLDEKKSAFSDAGWQVIVMSLLVKVVATVRAAHTVGAAGHAREIAVLVRSALESLITALFIAKDDAETRAKRWTLHATIIKARLLKKEPGISKKPEHLKARDEIVAQAREVEALFPNPALWASGLGKGSLRDLAVEVDMAWYYDFVYWSGSQATHGSAVSVESYVGTAADGTPIFKLGLSVEHIRAEIAVCCDILVRALALLNAVLKLDLDQLFTEVTAEYKAIFSEDPIGEAADNALADSLNAEETG